MTLALRARGDLATLDAGARDALIRRGGADPLARADAVLPIREAVMERGDGALLDLTEKHDGVRPNALEVPRSAWRDALADLSGDIRTALEAAHGNIAAFHAAQRPTVADVEVAPGVTAGRRAIPHARAGCYVPGGRAAYPSTVLMTVAPARAAGVGEVVVCSPPGPNGRPHALVLAAAEVAGADRVFSVGGAQAVFAMAYGTATVPRVDKLVGPGNAYVTAAKALVAGEVATDAPAGPSEVLVAADDTADPGLVAWDLAAQAEHDPDAAAVLVTSSPELAGDAEARLETILEDAARAGIIREALAARGAILTVPDSAAMARFADAYAPEHLSIHTADPRAFLEDVTNYGSAFLGGMTAVAFGDYCAGPNHVLPTGGLARGRGGLSTLDFYRLPTHLEVTAEGAACLASTTATLADAEGLPAHGASARARLNPPEGGAGP